MIFAVVGVVVLLAAGSVGYLKFGHKTAATNQAVSSQGTTTTMSMPKPSASMPASGPTTTTSATTEVASNETPDQDNAALRAQSDKMNHQLNAPSRIPNDLKMLAGKDAAPSSGFGAQGMDLGSGSNVFGGQSGPKVKVAAPQKVNISAGIAVGLLVQRTAPVYPPIARTARVSGTVVIQATISKTGMIENSRVVSGPTMLRQSALDAVKTWRFRPYLLDGEPVEVETTVNVVFNLAG
jgi:protein TonB